MRIENNLIQIQSYFSDNQPHIRQIGTFRIHQIQDWGSSLIVFLEEYGAIKIYVDKEKFRSSFSEGDCIAYYRITPVDGFRPIELEPDMLVDNTLDFFVHCETLEKSEPFFPWDPYW